MNENETLYESATAQHRAGQLDAAEAIYRQVLAGDAQFARAWHQLGLIQHQRGDSATGIQYVEHAIRLEPQWAVFYSNLGIIYGAVGRPRQAEAALRRGIEIAPKLRPAWLALGDALSADNRCEEAAGCFRHVLNQDPNDAAALAGLAYACGEMGLVEEAIAAYTRAGELSDEPAYRILAAIQLPLVYESQADLEQARNRLVSNVEALIGAGIVQNLTERSAMPVFSLAHQALNDVEIQRKIRRLYRTGESSGPSGETLGTSGKTRVGFVSSYFNSHTIGKLTRGLITRLSRERFHVTVFSVGQDDDAIAREFATAADRYVVLPRVLPLARRAILDNPVDVLVYTDIGMDGTTYSLAFSRLAPVQCATWGHPETTGLETIDYFVSSDLMEPPEADGHYSERMVRLPSLTFYYYRSQLPAQLAPREAFGLDPTARLYACPQSIYKFHPAFDEALAGILRRDREGQIVLIQWAYPQADEMLKRRFARLMPDVAERIVFIRRLQPPEFMNFLTLVDVLLDPFPYGGGNSSLEAFSFGVPIVTLPTDLLRGRITQAFCRRLGVEHCIARDVQDYVEIAVRLGRDRPFREQTRQQILANQKALFENESAIRDWETFLQRVAPKR